MNKRIWFGAAVVAGLISSLAVSNVGAQSKTMNLFIWSEYIDMGIVKEFEKANGVGRAARPGERHDQLRRARVKQTDRGKTVDVVAGEGSLRFPDAGHSGGRTADPRECRAPRGGIAPGGRHAALGDSVARAI